MSDARPRAADLVAGVSIAGLLLPEAIAYAAIAGFAPQAGVVALLVGLLVYGVAGSSRFAVVSATSSSATVLWAATVSIAPQDAGLRLAVGAGIVVLAGVFFLIAAAARLGAVSALVAQPVLRGFALGLALTIVLKQLPAVLSVPAERGDFLGLAWELAVQWRQWSLAGGALALAALLLLRWLSRWPGLPAATLVIAAGILLDLSGLCRAWGIRAVGPIALGWPSPGLPALTGAQWLGLVELGFVMALILFAESHGAIRSLALRHGDNVSTNRDLLALGLANLASGLCQGLPVGAGYSATAANEVAGARSRASGLVAAAMILVALLALLPWVARIPGPVLAAIVVHAIAHALDPAALRPYFQWRRDRLIALVAVAAVLVLGVLDGLLAAIGVSLLMLLRNFSRTRVSWLGRLGHSHDYVDIARHPQAQVPRGMLIARPEVPLFFGNADAVFALLRARVAATPGVRRVVLSLEEAGDLDATCVQALIEFAAYVRARGAELVLARVKDAVRDLLVTVDAADLPASRYAAWSVDDAVRQPR